MEPVIRSIEGIFKDTPIGSRLFNTAKLISIDDNPPTFTMNYSVIEPGKSAAHHIHPWEHEYYMLEGSGVVLCDGKEYPVREGDGILIPPNVEHCKRNTQTSGNLRRIDIIPLIGSQSNVGHDQRGKGTGQPPIIRNYRDIFKGAGIPARFISIDDNPPNYTMAYTVIEPGKSASHHSHPWEHGVFIVEGSGVMLCDGKEYPIKAGDAILTPANADHCTRNTQTSGNMRRIEISPLSAYRSTAGR